MNEYKKNRGRGRPKKNAIQEERVAPKRSRGRPTKHNIIETEVFLDADGINILVPEPKVKKVDQLYLFKKVMQYLIKVQVVHNNLFQMDKGNKFIFKRLMELDVQIIDICKKVLEVNKPK